MVDTYDLLNSVIKQAARVDRLKSNLNEDPSEDNKDAFKDALNSLLHKMANFWREGIKQHG